MHFTPVTIPGCMIVDIESHADERGFFARTWCREEFTRAGLPGHLVQASMSRNRLRGTTRGLHFQLPPSREGKLIRCTRGAIFDVAVDLRAASPTFLQHVGVELDAAGCRALFVAPGCAHGFQTLADDTDVLYQMTDSFAPELGSGIRWNDPRLAIDWPMDALVINPRDAAYPDLDESALRALSWD